MASTSLTVALPAESWPTRLLKTTREHAFVFALVLTVALIVANTITLPTQNRDRRAGIVLTTRSERRFRDYVRSLKIVVGRSRGLITTLSGGNQQKVVTGRWLAANPAVLLLNDPTRGVDIGAKGDIYQVLLDVARAGVAVVMLSTEVDEHIELMDRVLVFREGELTAEIRRAHATRQRLVASFFGSDAHDG